MAFGLAERDSVPLQTNNLFRQCLQHSQSAAIAPSARLPTPRNSSNEVSEEVWQLPHVQAWSLARFPDGLRLAVAFELGLRSV